MSEVQDFMPLGEGPQRLIRRVVGVRGCLRFRLELQPRFDYGRLEPTVEPTAAGVVFEAAGQALGFAAPVALEPTGAGVGAEFELGAGESRTFVLETAERNRGLFSGGGGIRTLGRGVAPTTVFETAPFNHSGTPPRCARGAADHSSGIGPDAAAVSCVSAGRGRSR